jgi:hypothetical protein
MIGNSQGEAEIPTTWPKVFSGRVEFLRNELSWVL